MNHDRKSWITTAHQGFVGGNSLMRPNTLSAFLLAAEKGADMIETDARTTGDGVVVCCHDPVVRGFDERDNAVDYVISETDSAVITRIILAPDDPAGIQRVPTLEETLHLCYFTGMRINIDLKEKLMNAEIIAHLAAAMGMRGRTVYAPNGAGADLMLKIMRIDPEAHFIDRPENFTAEVLKDIPAYTARCYAYTSDFSDKNIAKIRESGCMLAAISLNRDKASEAFRHHPDMAEYPHPYDFAAIEKSVHEEERKDFYLKSTNPA